MKNEFRYPWIAVFALLTCPWAEPAAGAGRSASVAVSTVLGSDVFQPVRIEGQESLSGLFRYEVDVTTTRPLEVQFHEVLGTELRMTVTVPGAGTRHFSGVIARMSQGDREGGAVGYKLEVVPLLWTLTLKSTSRVFQDKTVPQVVGTVLTEGGIAHSVAGLAGTFHPRNYVVQYRESDFDFISRLMEEEGIYYVIEHGVGASVVRLGNTPAGHLPLPGGAPVQYLGPEASDRKGRTEPSAGVHAWHKTQELRPGKVTLSDHHFQLPNANLQAAAILQAAVQAGMVVHPLSLQVNEGLEIFDYPGAYAKRFDGITPGGTEQPAELAKIQPDGQRTATLRIQELAASSLVVRGAATVPVLTAGHRFVLQNHFDANGEYVLTSVAHSVRMVEAKGSRTQFEYENRFDAIPVGLPYRPARRTPQPTIAGPQTAVVVGPADEEVFTDKYGRVKVRFHWDRTGNNDDASSCWLRVLQPISDGPAMIPGIGQEVAVGFLDGDPDRPIILGSLPTP